MTFFVKGIWGNVFTQIFLNVLSPRRAALFKKILMRNIFLLFISKGCVKNKPTWPKVRGVVKRALTFKRRFLCRNLYLNFRGCSTKKTYNFLKPSI